MEQIYKKIERYLKREFPDKQIIKADGRNALADRIVEYYGTGGMLIVVAEEGDKIYYQFRSNRHA